MIKIIFLWGLVFSAVSAHAGGQSSGSFHLLEMKCEAETAEQLDTTPQSPPLNVDDPSTPGCNKWEINMVVAGDLSLNERSLQLPLLDINYGIGDNIQLKYEVPNLTSQSDGTSLSGVGDSKLGLKYMFFENEESKTQIAIYPQVEFATPSSNAIDDGLETPGNLVTLPLLYTQKIGQVARGDVTFTGNIAYSISSKTEKNDYVSILAGIGMPVFNHVAIMGEIATDQSVSKNKEGLREQLTKVDLGLLISVQKHFMIFGSIGESIVSSDSKNHTYFVTGLRLL